MARVLLCDEADFDAQTSTCAAPYFGDAPSTLPSLSLDDASGLAGSIALLLAHAWCWKTLIRLVRDF